MHEEPVPVSAIPPWPVRLLASAGYLGLAPIYMLLPQRVFGRFSDLHRRQAAAVWSLWLPLLLLACGAAALLTYAVLYHRSWYEHTPLEVYAIATIRRVFLAWCVIAVFGAGMALAGSERHLPLVGSLSRFGRWLRASASIVVAIALLVAAVLLLAVYSSRHIPEETPNARVYMLYDDVNRYPRALFTLPFVRMAWAAEAAYGPGSAVAVELRRETLAQALAQAEVVYLAVHGTAKGLICEEGFLHPEDVDALPKGPDLRFVYLTGCDSGALAQEWTQAFAPALVQTYPRLTATLEHVWWMLAVGPRIVAQETD